MKVAISVWNNRISPVFDVARNLLVLEVVKGSIASEKKEHFIADGHLYKVSVIVDLQIETLICGAISKPLAKLIGSRDIKLIPFVAGDIKDIVAAYLADKLPCPSFLMPGCRKNRSKRGNRTSQINKGIYL